MIDVRQLIDLALSAPNIGMINLHALHTLLHVIVTKMDLDQCQVEFEREDRNGKMNCLYSLVPSLDKSIFIEEYDIELNENGEIIKRNKCKKNSNLPINMLVRIRKGIDNNINAHERKNQSPNSSNELIGGESDGEDGKYSSDEVTGTGSKHGEESGEETGKGSGEETGKGSGEKSGEKSDEKGDKETGKKSGEKRGEKRSEKSGDEAGDGEIGEKSSGRSGEAGGAESNKSKQRPDNNSENINNNSSYRQRSIGRNLESKHKNQSEFDDSELKQIKTDLNYLKMAVQRIALCSGMKDISNYLTKELATLEKITTNGTDTVIDGDGGGGGGTEESNDENFVENFNSQLASHSRKFDTLERKIMITDKRTIELEKKLSILTERIDDIHQTIELQKNSAMDTESIYTLISDIHIKVNQCLDQCKFLLESNEDTSNTIEQLLKTNAELKITKCDRDEIEDLLADKADYTMVQLKVSKDQFDANKREIGCSINELLEKNDELEKLIKEQDGVFSKHLNNKIGMIEFKEMENNLLNKINNLKERIIAISQLKKRESEAAGGSGGNMKYLRDLQCLSCGDENILMRKKDIGFSVPKLSKVISPAEIKNTKPRLTFEVDKIRKDMQILPITKNLIHLENAIGGKKNQPLSKQQHNRYCGGSHTILNPSDNYRVRNQRDKNLLTGNGDDGSLFKGIIKQSCCCGENKSNQDKSIDADKQIPPPPPLPTSSSPSAVPKQMNKPTEEKS